MVIDSLGLNVVAIVEAELTLAADILKKSTEVDPPFGAQPRFVNSMHKPSVPGIGIRATVARPNDAGIEPDKGASATGNA